MRTLAALLVLALLEGGCGSRSEEASAPPPGKPTGEPCASADECGSGLVCFGGVCAAGYPASPICTPPGSPATALGDPIVATEPPADGQPGSCMEPLRDPSLPSAEVQDLGVHTVGDQVTFDVPVDTRSLSVMSQEIAGTAPLSITVTDTNGSFQVPNTVVPDDVRTPGGSVFYSDTAPLPSGACWAENSCYPDATQPLAFYLGGTVVSGTFTIPNTAAGLDRVRSDGQVSSGSWRLTVNDWALECTSMTGCTGGSSGGQYRVQVVTEPGPFASTGALDVEVYLATDPAGPLPSAAAAKDDPQVARFVRSLSAYFARAGICVGTVTFHDLPDWAKTRYAPNGEVDITSTGPCDALAQLFTLAVANRRAVHVVFAEALVDRSNTTAFTVLGVDGSIPGPSGFPGTINGGAVVGLLDQLGAPASACPPDGAVPTLTCGTDRLAYVAAHEVGHWLGLYHVTERTGTFFDPLSDTATCPCLSCVPRFQRSGCAEKGGTTTSVVISDCVQSDALCGGGRNLMFWLLDDELSTGELSFQQGDVMRLNPAVRVR